MAEAARAAIETLRMPLPVGGELRVTVSFGVAAWEALMHADELIAPADGALYRARRRGRNRVEVSERF